MFSSFSLLHSTLDIKKILSKKPSTLSIIDNNLSWILDYGIKIQNENIKVIIGYSFLYLGYEIVLYVKDDIGYKNLCLIYANGFDLYKSNIEGLICTIACNNRNILNEFKEIFKNDLYILVNRSSKEEILLADELDIFILADYTICHLDTSDYTAYKTLRAIDQNKYLVQIPESKCAWLSSEEIYKLYFDIPDAIYNTYTLASKCNFIIKSSPISLPIFETDQTIDKLAFEGLKNKKLHNNQIYIDRLNHELSVIKSMQFEGYFLIVSDFVTYAKKNKIPVGPGRGSGAGSLTAYCLNITNIDPIEMGLFFERFLNPNRVTMPDFDIDFCPLGRAQIVQYLQDKYGYYHIAHIVTFGKLQTKSALRDVARVLSIPFNLINTICNMIPFIPVKPLTIDDALELENVKDEIENDQSLIELFQIAKQIEGLHRHSSIHAAGVVISKEFLLDYIPTKIENQQLIVSCEVNNIETAGLVKFDLLGLANLTLIQNISDKVKINISQIPLNDKKTFKLLSSGDTHGIFQLEGKAMKDILVKLNVSKLSEIIAVVSLYRPGPMSSIPDFIENKYNQHNIKYEYDEMKSILKETFGIIVYQEQVLQIAQKMAGYTVGEADLLRRAMGKKKPEEMKIHKEKFISGIIKYSSNQDQEKAEKLFETISKFAGYAFCKAHAAPYGLISYQTAYLKAHYKYEFITEMLNMHIHDTSEIENIIYNTDCEILKPDINKSSGYFKVYDGKILYGLYAIKNIGEKVLYHLVNIENRSFKSIKELFFLKLNKAQWENLIFSGALDNLIETREEMQIYISSHKHMRPTLFDIKLNHKKIHIMEQVKQEKQSLGLIITQIKSKILFKYTGFKIGIVSKVEKYKNGSYKINIITDRKLNYLFNKYSYNGIIVYKDYIIYEIDKFLNKISNIYIKIDNEEEMQEISTLNKGKTNIYINISGKIYNIGQYQLDINIIQNENIYAIEL